MGVRRSSKRRADLKSGHHHHLLDEHDDAFFWRKKNKNKFAARSLNPFIQPKRIREGRFILFEIHIPK